MVRRLPLLRRRLLVAVGVLSFGLACGGVGGRNSQPFMGGHTSAIVDVDAQGALLATAGEDGVVNIWTWPDLQGIRSIPLRQFGTALAFSPDGTKLAVAERDAVVAIWETSTWTRVERLDHVGSALDWAGGRLVVAVREESTVAVYDGVSFGLIGLLEGHTAPVVDLAFSADGLLLGTASADRTARVWDVSSGQERQMYAGHRAGVVSVAFSPDGQSLATGSQDKTARVWDLGSGEPTRQLSGHRDWVVGLAFSSEPDVLVSADKEGRYRVWSTTDGQALDKVEPAEGEDQLAFEEAMFVGDDLVLVGGDIYVASIADALKKRRKPGKTAEPLDARCAKLVDCGKTLMRSTDGTLADRGLEIVKMAREMDIGGPAICLNTLVALPNVLGEAPPVECSP